MTPFFGTNFQRYDLINDIVSLGLGIATIVIAGKGLRTWQREIKRKSNYDLAKKLLRATYQMRSAFDVVRNPMMFESEYGTIPDNLKSDEKRVHELKNAYYTRRQSLVTTQQELDNLLLEGEIAFGSGIHELFDRLFQKKGILLTHIHRIIDNEGLFKQSKKFPDEDIIYAEEIRKQDDGNWFSEEIQEVIVSIEDFLRPHLTK